MIPQEVNTPAVIGAGGWSLRVRDLGHTEYRPVWEAMRAFTDARHAETPDELWLTQHAPVFTLGQAGRPEHLRRPGGIPLVHCDRGGQVTYHGPGQLVAYPLLDLKRLGLGIKELVWRIEQAVLLLLGEFGVSGRRRAGMPGVYVGEAKIAALGLRVRRGCCYHGLALNVDMDLQPFARINPCGYAGLQVTDLQRAAGRGLRPSMGRVRRLLVRELATQFGAEVMMSASIAPESRSRV